MDSVLGKSHANWIVALTLLVAACLAIVPLPDWLVFLRPEWLPLVLIYWVMALPHRVGLFTAWTVGFFTDVLEGSLLGLNGLCYVLVAWLCFNLYQRFRMFTLLQQSSVVLVLVGIIQIVNFWVLNIAGLNAGGNFLVMLSAVTSAVVWPFVFVTLRHLRRAFSVS